MRSNPSANQSKKIAKYYNQLIDFHFSLTLWVLLEGSDRLHPSSNRTVFCRTRIDVHSVHVLHVFAARQWPMRVKWWILVHRSEHSNRTVDSDDDWRVQSKLRSISLSLELSSRLIFLPPWQSKWWRHVDLDRSTSDRWWWRHFSSDRSSLFPSNV